MDLFANYISQIKNNMVAGHPSFTINSNNLLVAVSKVLKEEGYINGFEEVNEGVKKYLRVNLKLRTKKQDASIHGIEQVSHQSVRVYKNYNEIPNVWNGLGVAIMSTSKGVITGKEAKANKVGGEVLAFVW